MNLRTQGRGDSMRWPGTRTYIPRAWRHGYAWDATIPLPTRSESPES